MIIKIHVCSKQTETTTSKDDNYLNEKWSCRKNHRPLIKELFFEFYEDINTVWSIDLPIKVPSKITLYFFKCLFPFVALYRYTKKNQNFITSSQCKDEQYFDDVNPDSKQSRISAERAIIWWNKSLWRILDITSKFIFSQVVQVP